MSTSVIKASKVVLIKTDIVVDDIFRIWSNIHSRYSAPKTLIGESYAVLRSNPKKSLKLLKKARRMMVKESILAQDYNNIHDAVKCSDDVAISNLDNKYLRAIESGDYSGASKYLSKLKSKPELQGVFDVISVKIHEGMGKIALNILNSQNTHIEIRRMDVSAGATLLNPDLPYPFLVGPNTDARIEFACDGVNESIVSIIIEYVCGGKTRTYRDSYTLKKV